MIVEGAHKAFNVESRGDDSEELKVTGLGVVIRVVACKQAVGFVAG